LTTIDTIEQDGLMASAERVGALIRQWMAEALAGLVTKAGFAAAPLEDADPGARAKELQRLIRDAWIAGVLTLVWYDVPSGRKAWVEDVVVDAAARGCGAGEALVKAATEHAARIGAAKVMLTSNPAREAARGLYRKIGFEEAGTTVFVFKTDRK
jgi:ribosomal protein S18 acetylase RimI-like enzyme